MSDQHFTDPDDPDFQYQLRGRHVRPDATAATEVGDQEGGVFGAIRTAVFGEPTPEQADAQRRAIARIERMAELDVSDAATRARQAAQLRDQKLRRARARALQAQAIAWLIIGIGIELLVLLPLLVWGIWTGAVFG